MNVFLGVILFASLFSAYNPFNDGAMSRIRVLVVDDLGNNVPDASVSVSYFITPERCKRCEGRTNEEGEFLSQSKNCIGEWIVSVDKDGYYGALYYIKAQDKSFEDVKKTKSWSRDVFEEKVVLKRMLSPKKMLVNDDVVREKAFPANHQTMGFDLLINDWCSPFGRGKYDDIQIYRDCSRSDQNPLDIYELYVITTTNCLDGVIRMRLDKKSSLSTMYHAPINGEYQKKMAFEYDRRGGVLKIGRNSVEHDFPKDEYLIFRTRTVTNEVGEIVSANYGYIKYFSIENGLKMRIFFNEEVNDLNMEDSSAKYPYLWPKE